jgi:hypothetical protein
MDMTRRDEPFRRRIRKRWVPPEMTTAPVLDPNGEGGPVSPRYALLINPFYPKDPNASFGKHVLTPPDQLGRSHTTALAG